MSQEPERSVEARRPRVLLIAAADEAVTSAALRGLREAVPGAHVTAVVAPGRSVAADRQLAAAAQGPYGFAVRPALVRELRRGFDLAWAAVMDLDSPAYRRTALLLSVARSPRKAVFGPGGEVVPLSDWLRRAGISLGLVTLAGAALRRLGAPYTRTRARRLLHGGKPPWGFRRVNIGISDRCNHRCIMCSEHSPYCADGGRRMAAADILSEGDFGIMEAEMYRGLIEDLSAMGCREIELCGLGEPLVHPQVFDFLKRAKEAGLWVRLVTNAGLLDEEKARRLVALGLDELHVSINAGTAETYAKIHGVSAAVFERVLAGIRAVGLARDQSGRKAPAIETSFVVQAGNFEEPAAWVERVAEAGADIVTFSALGAAPPEAPVQLTTEQMETAALKVAEAEALGKAKGLQVRGTFGALAEGGPSFSAAVYAHMPCYIGHVFALVTADGRIFPCCACERVVGDMREGGFARAWRGAGYVRFREECLDLPNRLPAVEGCSCMACPYGPWNVEFHERLYGGSKTRDASG